MTFLWVHSNSRKLSYLSWQSRCPNLKITCHIKPKLFLWTKLPKKLTLVAATLMFCMLKMRNYILPVFQNMIQIVEKTSCSINDLKWRRMALYCSKRIICIIKRNVVKRPKWFLLLKLSTFVENRKLHLQKKISKHIPLSFSMSTILSFKNIENNHYVYKSFVNRWGST